MNRIAPIKGFFKSNGVTSTPPGVDLECRKAYDNEDSIDEGNDEESRSYANNVSISEADVERAGGIKKIVAMIAVKWG